MCGSDPHTSSNFDSFKCNHVDLDWNVNFGSKCIEGSSTTHLTCKVSNANQIVLDCHHLVIKSVSVSTLDGLHVDTTFNCKDDSQFGGALVIYGSYCENSSYKVQIMYHTTPNCTALQWLHPGQTKDGLFPFLFSQCQAIHARTMLPCQDTPSSRFTYSAHVKIADRFAHSIQVVMSANVRTFNEGKLSIPPSSSEHEEIHVQIIS